MPGTCGGSHAANRAVAGVLVGKAQAGAVGLARALVAAGGGRVAKVGTVGGIEVGVADAVALRVTGAMSLARVARQTEAFAVLAKVVLLALADAR